jgi:hypothetical protein
MDIAQTIINVLLLTLLGLLIAFNPALIIVDLFVVLQSKKPIRDALILISGVLLPLIIVAAISIFWLKPDSSFHIGTYASKINIPPLIEIIFGLSLLVYASVHQLKKPARHEKSAIKKKSMQIIASPGSIFTFSFVKSSLSITNLLAVVVLAKIINENKTGPLPALIGIMWALLIGISPLLAMPYMHRYRPHHLMRIQSKIDRLLSRENSALITILLSVIGLGFMIHGVIKLT